MLRRRRPVGPLPRPTSVLDVVGLPRDRRGLVQQWLLLETLLLLLHAGRRAYGLDKRLSLRFVLALLRLLQPSIPLLTGQDHRSRLGCRLQRLHTALGRVAGTGKWRRNLALARRALESLLGCRGGRWSDVCRGILGHRRPLGPGNAGRLRGRTVLHRRGRDPPGMAWLLLLRR